MKVIILAGGLPSTLSEENDRIPKPMVEIGERPILWHIMKLYSHYGLNDFIICTGYKADLVKQYFMNYYIYRSDITVDLKDNDITIHNNVCEPWIVTIVDTGLNATTAERIASIKEYIDDDNFVVTYGDCISDINIQELINQHIKKETLLTVVVAKPTGRNATLNLDESGELLLNATVEQSSEEAWVNACSMVLKKETFSYMKPADRFEVETINRMAKSEKVNTYKHNGFWTPVETMRDKIKLELLWEENKAPWKIWND